MRMVDFLFMSIDQKLIVLVSTNYGISFGIKNTIHWTCLGFHPFRYGAIDRGPFQDAIIGLISKNTLPDLSEAGPSVNK